MKQIIKMLAQAGSSSSKKLDWGILPYILTIIGNSLWPIAWIYCNQNKVNFASSTFARGLVTITFSYAGCLYTDNKNVLGFRNNLKLLIIRSVIMTMHSCTIGLAQFILPLPICHTISCSGCLFIFIIDYILNGTKINNKQALGIFIGISGVLLVANDKIITKWFNPSYQYKTVYQNYLITDSTIIFIFTLFYCMVVIAWAYGIVITRVAKANTFQINFMLGFAFYMIAYLIMPYTGYLGYHQLSFTENLKIILFTGLPCFIVQILVIASLTMSKQTGVISLMGFSAVSISYLISIFRYNEIPNVVNVIGITLVVGGCTKTVLNTSIN